MKRILIFLLVISMLLLSACKTRESGDISTNDDILNQTVVPVVNDTPDDAVDPENAEVETQIGNKVTADTLTSNKGVSNGIDVSKWQGKIDWSSVKKSGIDFAIIRVGYRAENGNIYPDANADYNIQQAQKAGILVGVYFFSTANSKKEATEEAAFVADTIKGYKISYPVAYDCEGYENADSRMYGLSAKERTEIAVSFLSYIENRGYTGMFYASKSALENGNYWDKVKLEKSYKIWLAHYPTPTYPQIENPSYNGKYDMWQYTNRGVVGGIEGNCDMIVSYTEFKEADAKDKSATKTDATPPKTQQELIYTAVSDSVTAKEKVNLRLGPSTKYDVAGVLTSGTFLTRTGIGSNGWSRLDYNGKTVYAITSYLSDRVIEVQKEDIVNGVKFTAKSDRVTAKDEVNLRAAPTTNSEAVGKLSNGVFLERTAVSDKGWSRLNFNGKTVYAVTSYLTTDEESKNNVSSNSDTGFTTVSDRVTAKDEVNLRAKPSTDSDIVGKLVGGTFLERTGKSDKGWSRLIYNGQTVYAVTSYLTDKAPEISQGPNDSTSSSEIVEHGVTFKKVTPKNVTAKEETNLRDKPSPDSNIVYTLKNGEYVTKNASGEGWARLSYNGQTVYAVESLLR